MVLEKSRSVSRTYVQKAGTERGNRASSLKVETFWQFVFLSVCQSMCYIFVVFSLDTRSQRFDLRLH